MKKTVMRLLALILALMMVLCACDPLRGNVENGQTIPTIQTDPTDPTNPPVEVVVFEDMEYARQDLDELEALQQAVIDGTEAEDDVVTLMDKVFAFYEAYHNYYTGYALANIHYSKDLTDSYWEEEYNYCLDTSAQVDAMLDQMLYVLAEYPQVEELETEEYFGEDFFEDYQGESLWDETFTALMERESELQSQYYAIEAEAVDANRYSEEFYSTYGAQLADVYVELVRVRQEIAAYAGYADYPSFAYDFYFDRDYSPAQAQALMDDIQTYLVPLYHGIDYRELSELYGSKVSASQTFLYTKSCAKNMGGILWEAFDVMERGNLYDIEYSTKKYNASFEMYISNYNQPYVFVNPSKSVQDKLTFTHEFGHFANDYASAGSVVGIDVAEFFSQGLEYLSLSYAGGGNSMVKLQMVNSLCLYVEQSLYASFEQRVYALQGDELTKENVFNAFRQTGKDFGFGNSLDGRNFVLVPHFFISPMYIISYVVSNDAALQLYQLEQAEPGAGATKYMENLDTTVDQFLSFVASAGLESPFVEGRIEKVAKTFEDALK